MESPRPPMPNILHEPPCFKEFEQLPRPQQQQLYELILERLRNLEAKCAVSRADSALDGDRAWVHASIHQPTGDSASEKRGTNTASVDLTTTLIGKLIIAVETIPEEVWKGAVLEFERPPLQDRAVSMGFIVKMVESLKAARPLDIARLNSYMIVGSKNLDCACDPDKLDDCTHFQDGKDGRVSWATEPWHIREPWIIRAITWRTGGLSLVETLMLATKITGAPTRGSMTRNFRVSLKSLRFRRSELRGGRVRPIFWTRNDLHLVFLAGCVRSAC
jgi:hypothetical protein